MSGETEEVVVSRDAGTGTAEAEASPGTEHRIVLHDEPPVYSLSVAYGDFEVLFQDPATVAGRQERMQVCGFYYGEVDGDEGAITRRCARHLREELEHDAPGGTLTDDQFREAFQRLVRCTVRKADGSLAPEDDFSANARLAFPGSFCFRNDNQLGNPISRARFNAERDMWDGNQALGRIPIVATVRNAAGDPVQGVRVAFEFIPPYDTPDDQKDYLNQISGATEKTRSPRAYVRSRLPAAASAPFGFNCPEAKGGKIPADVLGSLVAQGEVRGFPYQAGTGGRPNNFSVTVDSDAEGKAGIAFTPSRMGGDCYKIKVTVLVDGREPLPAETVSSGVLTVWRTLRLARIVIKPVAAGFAGAPALAPGFAGITGALGTISLARMRTEYAKAFHLLESDRRAETPMTMTARSYRDAMQFAKRGAANPIGWDLDALVKEDMASPYLIWLDSDTNYNANRRAGTPALDLTVANTWSDISALIDELLDRFMVYWNGGSLPGVTVIRSELGDSYSYSNNPNLPGFGTNNAWNATTSGVALRRRGCYVWYSNQTYQNNMSYGLTENTMHEMGHVLYLRHHWTGGGLGTEAGGFSANHDNRDWCLMGYLTLTTNDYCGKCLLKLRGWDETAL